MISQSALTASNFLVRGDGDSTVFKRVDNSVNGEGEIRIMVRVETNGPIEIRNFMIDGNGRGQPPLDPDDPLFPYQQQFSAGFKIIADAGIIQSAVVDGIHTHDPTADGVLLQSKHGFGFGDILITRCVGTGRNGYPRSDISVTANCKTCLVYDNACDFEIEIDGTDLVNFLNYTHVRNLDAPHGLDINIYGRKPDGSYARVIVEDCVVGTAPADGITMNNRFNVTLADATITNVVAGFDSRCYLTGKYIFKDCSFTGQPQWQDSSDAMFDQYGTQLDGLIFDNVSFAAHPNAIANGLEFFVKSDGLTIPAV